MEPGEGSAVVVVYPSLEIIAWCHSFFCISRCNDPQFTLVCTHDVTGVQNLDGAGNRKASSPSSLFSYPLPLPSSSIAIIIYAVIGVCKQLLCFWVGWCKHVEGKARAKTLKKNGPLIKLGTSTPH